jgi:hypothetical protein
MIRMPFTYYWYLYQANLALDRSPASAGPTEPLEAGVDWTLHWYMVHGETNAGTWGRRVLSLGSALTKNSSKSPHPSQPSLPL